MDTLERLDVLDQRALVVVAEGGLFGKFAGTEVMAAIDDEVGTLADRKQRLDQVGEDLSRLLIAGALWQALPDRASSSAAGRRLFPDAATFLPCPGLAKEIDVGQQIDRRSGGNRADHDALAAKQPGKEALLRSSAAA